MMTGIGRTMGTMTMIRTMAAIMARARKEAARMSVRRTGAAESGEMIPSLIPSRGGAGRGGVTRLFCREKPRQN